ncbi:UNVERIFIED_CONTAM: hypothetical protein GTU68_023464 [Idotea baltica]|nr:hypothetical protein [Idotea baltica]
MTVTRLATIITLVGTVLLFLAVLVGAFGAHALSDLLEKNNRVDVFTTASRYHFYHGLALVLLGVIIQLHQKIVLSRVITLCFLLGIILFSGSLYFLAIFNVRWLGAITPIGGVLLLSGWALLAYSMIRNLASIKESNNQAGKL